ncbi:Uncharacterised protein [Delftia tsuruhatensis]|uniref:hypothetical protein n=1 Tax=Delftia tsuruhatensis TaxID=180282 RepID=UPI001E7B55D3|nr:hypothetical protein [Delftia tsuruhatensis]CAB5699945.1 Uncharacterised protein [Delftia tsuruhatensis]CAC9693598.1 Uncharacterised protein [Delftia tsuruhatensis]
MRRLLLFFYGNGNLAGLALALLGPVLLFTGVIGAGWGWITLGLYGAGLLLGWALRPADAGFERALRQHWSAEDIRERIDELAHQAAPLLTAEMQRHLDSVRGSVHEVLPALADAGPVFNDGLFTVRETVLEYLPATLSHYAALPPLFRVTQPVHEGKTPRQLLTEQLALLAAQMQQVVAHVAASDAQALLANGRFLKQKFDQPDFLK